MTDEPQVAVAQGWLVVRLGGYRWNVIAKDNGREARFAELYAQARAARAQTRALVRRVRVNTASVRAECERIQASWERAERVRQLWVVLDDPQRLRYSAYARLQARLASLPVIEQAKGILMAQCGWPADQAFDALRLASQQENIKVRDLAEMIVARTMRQAQRHARSPRTSAASGAAAAVPIFHVLEDCGQRPVFAGGSLDLPAPARGQ